MTDDDLIRRGDVLAAAADLYRWSIAAGEELEAAIAALAPTDATQAREAALLEALQWCSGSDDFQEGGKAREGWLKLCAPLLIGEARRE